MKIALLVSCVLIVLVLVENLRWKLSNIEAERDDSNNHPEVSHPGEHRTPR